MKDFAIVILSCDKYSDLWPGFFYQLDKNLKTDIPKYLISNFQNYRDNFTKNLNVIQNHEESNWSSNFLKALNLISEKKIFVILEDIFISSKVDANKFTELLQFAVDEDVQHIKYMGYPRATIPFNALLSRYEAGMPYLVSVCGIWDKKYLSQLILDGENPWEFEVNASYRAKFSATKFYGCLNPLFEYKNMVEKGGWIPSSIQWALRQNIPVDYQNRTVNRVFMFNLKKYFYRLSMCIPWKLRVRLIGALKKIIISY